MKPLPRPLILMAALTTLVHFPPDTAEAAKRQPGMGVGQCWIDGTPNPAGQGEAISSCCLEDGCWICNATWNDCVWDPKVGSRAVRGTVGAGPGKLTIDPGRRVQKTPAARSGAGAIKQ